MRTRRTFLRQLVSYLIPLTVAPSYAAPPTKVLVIAHSISTEREARVVVRRNDMREVYRPADADALLVVCRSGLSWPLDDAYESVEELSKAADSQMNISGEKFHVYLYTIDSDSRVRQAKHRHYPVTE